MLANTATGPHQGQPIFTAGEALDKASAAMILIHGRGANAADILSLTQYIGGEGFAYLAPQAAAHTWYPQSFLAPIPQNEPNLSSALETVASALKMITEAGLPPEKIIIGGFSQGACLSSEFVARNAQRYGGLLGFSGGLIGPPETPREYEGSLDGTPVFLGCSNIDFHIPEARVHETTTVLTRMGANVTEKIYPNMGHTIIEDELIEAKKIVDLVIG
ncbi:MAG: dienelactone hydrolase family protein [Chloroflexota bacterium]